MENASFLVKTVCYGNLPVANITHIDRISMKFESGRKIYRNYINKSLYNDIVIEETQFNRRDDRRPGRPFL